MFPTVIVSHKSNFSNWVNIRRHWEKNRRIFNLIYINTLLPFKFLRIAEKIRKIDLNLIFAWKKSKYTNLCSTIVIQYNSWTKKENFICRRPLINRNLQQIFFIELNSGCICCTSDTNKNAPIWWDELSYIPLFLNQKITKLLLYRFHYYSILKKIKANISDDKKFSLKKISKLSNHITVHISLRFYFPKFFKFVPHLEFIKKWYLLF